MKNHKEPDGEVPEGAAVFPTIPPQTGVDPLVLALLHAVVFLEGSDEHIVEPDAATEALDHIAHYLQRLDKEAAKHVATQVQKLLSHAKTAKWSEDQTGFLNEFLESYGLNVDHGK